MILSPAMHARLCAARTLLCSPDATGLTIEQLAARVNVSAFHLTRQFAAVFGTTPHQYRTAARLSRARELLARGEHTVTEVCLELGFSSLGSFSTLFRTRVGVSPLAYQRRMRRLWSVPDAPSAVLAPGCFGLMGLLPPRAAEQLSRSSAGSADLESAARCP